ncbi:hypothetical protein SAMN04488040_0793 [Sulfitobacter marinus]|uniref:DUF6456 domain-containing protein n=1 Tax=Sulfitobacter marinus TaxID=394264 RepID=A0A1I6QLM3_9RHOB|nr:DUF6456 domain-containing protein [Sulfitobacter marinus]SFS53361.1 hypothetical protein SAMN04488040_0793 [Sulfitobacter marinus]
MTGLLNTHTPPFSAGSRIPGWVPTEARHYLSHVELGRPIRALARSADCHASTILRQIRKLETRRDDPLIDDALETLGRASRREKPADIERPTMTQPNDPNMPDDETLTCEARRILRRLCETGAVLAVAAEMEKAVVVRDGAGGTSTRTAVVDRPIAQAMALKGWIATNTNGRITRYFITAAGRTALEQMLQQDKPRTPQGFADAQAEFTPRQDTDEAPRISRRARYSLAESPLAALARRRDKDGTNFLSDRLVQAGERLREDFELAQMGEKTTQNWDRFLTPGGDAPTGGFSGSAPSAARARVASALADLGPGLSDIVLRCCCYLEGLETTERRLGWSARSGKIVLRIALMRLRTHYDETLGPESAMIG